MPVCYHDFTEVVNCTYRTMAGHASSNMQLYCLHFILVLLWSLSYINLHLAL